MEQTSPLLAAQNISVTMGSLNILDSVSLTIGRSEIVTLIGPNGSGKTTLVRALLGLVPLGSGHIERRATRIGYVPQVFPRDRSLPMTALHFVTVLGGGNEKDARRMLERTGVAHAAGRQMSALSGGELARVALARALLRAPELLVLDEPLTGVDVIGEAALYALIAELRHETGVSVLLVSHDLHMVMAAADHVICLNRHICCEGDPRAVADDPAFLQLFGKQVAEQIAPFIHRHDHTHGHVHAPHEHGHE
jgi:zinc transport system ATP-binding protein